MTPGGRGPKKTSRLKAKSKHVRCAWAVSHPLSIVYHDLEWGVPVHDDRHLFEMLLLEGAQAGLNWLTVLKKRENYRVVFDNFDAEKITRYDARKVKTLLSDIGIIRNRLKIASAIGNAKAYIATRDEFGSFDAYIWQFVHGRPIVNSWKRPGEVPVSTPESEAMSKDLVKRGFRFVGPTICYAYMQATGMVNDHTTDCFRHGRRA